ncbi:MAG: patatin-like phospholipase family protein [Candidatus Kapabacteria bacterium]|nr:patatin-like phospholipase family protein [Candidatus Kapabacteria bacterium]
MKHIFVLSGGSIRGAWQTGALLATLERLPATDEIAGIFGVSVGALNAAFLASNTVYKAGTPTTVSDLLAGCNALKSFWSTKVTGPHSLVNGRSPAELAQSIIGQGGSFTGWKGLADHAPLIQLYKTVAIHANIAQAPYTVKVGYTDYVTGRYSNKDLRTDAKSDQAVENLVFASAVTPLIMDYIRLQKASGDWARLSDGGLRHVVPSTEVVDLVKALIAAGSAAGDVRVHTYVCSPALLPEWIIGNDRIGSHSKRPGLLDIIDRAFSMMTQSVVEADLYKLSTEINGLGSSTKVYQNPTEYLTNSIVSFTSADVASMLQFGYDHAKGALQVPPRIA